METEQYCSPLKKVNRYAGSNLTKVFFSKDINENSYDEYKNTAIFVKDNDYFRKINFRDILYIEASGSYSFIHTATNKYCVSFNLSEIAPKLPVQYFIRTHRSLIINLLFTDSFIGNQILLGKHKVSVSKKYKSEFISRLNILGKVRL